MRRSSAWPLSPIAKARAVVTQKSPYYAVGLYRFHEVSVPDLETLVVDASGRLYVDEVMLTALVAARGGLHTAASILVHELLHILDRHPERAVASGVNSAEGAGLWNIAADLALCKLMKSGGWQIEGMLQPKDFKLKPGLTVEAYYRALKELEDPPSAPEQASPGRGSCGSCATGTRSPWEREPEAGTEETAARQALTRRLVAQAIIAHAKARGSVPADLLRLAEGELAPPKVPWQRVLAGMVRSGIVASGKTDFSRSKPSRRQQATPDVLRPAMVRPVPCVAVVVDTSASMEQNDLLAALAEVRGILRATGASVTVLAVDAAVGSCRNIWRIKQVELVGGGGTDMGEGMRAAARLTPRPDVVAVITDGWTSWPRRRPTTCPVVVVLVGAGRAGPNSVPNWARAVEVT